MMGSTDRVNELHNGVKTQGRALKQGWTKHHVRLKTVEVEQNQKMDRERRQSAEGWRDPTVLSSPHAFTSFHLIIHV